MGGLPLLCALCKVLCLVRCAVCSVQCAVCSVQMTEEAKLKRLLEQLREASGIEWPGSF